MGLATDREISCRITKTLLLYVRECNNGSLGSLLDGLELDEQYLLDTDNWVSHAFLHRLYDRMVEILKDENAVYHMALASDRVKALGMLDRIVRLLGSPHLIYSQSPVYNKLLKLNGDVHIHEIGDSWTLLEDRYHVSDEKTRYDCDYTRGILEGIPTIFDMPPAQVEEIECQVAAERYGRRTWPDAPRQGAKGCLYKVRWDSKSKPSFWKRFLKYGIYIKAIRDLRDANTKIGEKYNEVREMAANLQKINQELEQARSKQDDYLRKLEISESRYRLLAENLSDMIWTMDLDTMRFTYISPSVEKVRGFTPQEAMELSAEQMLAPQSMKDVAEVLACELAAEAGGNADPNRSRTMPVSQLCKDGSYAWGEVTMTFLRDGDGRAVGILGVTHDITERRRAEEERQSLQERLQRAEKMEALGTLAGGVAHDLNNVLGVVVGFSELLLSEIDESSEMRPRVLNIMQGGERAAAIVQDLLTLARRGVHTEKVININSAIIDLQKSPEFLKLASLYPNVRITTDLETDLLNIKGSPVHLAKTLFNLVCNALEAMPDSKAGMVTITTDNRYLDKPLAGYDHIQEGDYVVLSVSDTGEGIPAAELARIFEPFYTKKVMGKSGTGLGLSVVWGTVKDHNGYINVQSNEGKGSTLTLYFPVTREEISPDQLSLSVSEYMGNGESILVVDDIKGQRELAAEMLTKLNYKTVQASCGEEAVEYLKTGSADVVVLDMIMDPGMDGLETYKKILEIRPQQKAVIVSGFSETNRVSRAQELGAGAYVRKPYVLEKLGLAIRRELDRPL
jgi:PAS domain S-box-containing protein